MAQAIDGKAVSEARWIEEWYPQPEEPALRQGFQRFKAARGRVDYPPQDVEVRVRGDVAWITATLDSTWNADTEAGKAMLGGKSEARRVFVESELLVTTPNAWGIALDHTTYLPPFFGSSPDHSQEQGGMNFANAREGSPVSKTGFRAGDVMIDVDSQIVGFSPTVRPD